MPSRAESSVTAVRREGLLRGVAFAALLAATIVAVLRLRNRDDSGATVVHRRIVASPSAAMRDSLAAFLRAGHRVSWSGSLASVAAMAEPVREPGTRWRLSVVGAAALLVRDSLGPVDSLEAAATLTLEPTRGAAQIVEGNTVAIAAVREVAPPRRVLLLGRAGFEPRFIITALEEAGWLVDTRLALGREREVRQGERSLQLARHDVVIVTDSASANREATSIARFVRSGGGLILAGEANAASAPALRAIAAARVLREEDPETRSFEGHEPTHALPLFALGNLVRDAEVLEDREGTPVVVARRVESGRVLQVGFAETWRWRMEGEGRSIEEHREYWSRLGGIVARGQAGAAAVQDVRSSAPLAAMVHAVGPAAETDASSPSNGPAFPLWLGPIILLALLFEWGSRRRRGAA